MHEQRKKAIVLDVMPKGAVKAADSARLAELISLTETAGGILIKKVVQKRGRPSAKTYLGSGKIAEAAEYCKAEKIELVIVNGVLKPHQYENLGKTFEKGVKIWDRIDLILNIFDRQASSPEAKMQIKLARLHHEIPKLYSREATTLFERAGAGIGTRGAGEKGIEAEKRHIRRQIKSLEEKLETIRKKQFNQRNARNNTGMKTVALIGYTNAGKSTLMKLLTKKQNISVKDAPFVTLETKIGRVWIPDLPQGFLLADTIGFIRELPPQLIESFLTTLQEAQTADLLIHVIDISDPEFRQKIDVVEEILEQINCSHIPKFYVFNKLDRCDEYKQLQEENACLVALHEFRRFSPAAISITDSYGIHQLKQKLSECVLKT
jgi:GTP-binding protein HflX